jgi:hypothetical protein
MMTNNTGAVFSMLFPKRTRLHGVIYRLYEDCTSGIMCTYFIEPEH